MRRLFSRLGSTRQTESAAPAAPSDAEGATEAAPRHAYAFVALRRGTLAPTAQLRLALGKWLPGEDVYDLQGDDRWVTFKCGTSCFMVTLAPVPLPKGSLQTACERAWEWPTAAQDLRDHRAHLMVLVSDFERDACDQALRLTRVVAALLETHEAIAVAWSRERVLTPRARFLAAAAPASRTAPPVLLWVECQVRMLERGVTSVRTRGLRQFECRELETLESGRGASELVRFVCETASALLSGRSVSAGPIPEHRPGVAAGGGAATPPAGGRADVLRLVVQ